jgi:hypothetical protein
MAVDRRDLVTGWVQQAVEEAIADMENVAARMDSIVPPGSIPLLSGWPEPSWAARKRAQEVVCQAVSSIQALEPQLRGDVVYTELRELPEVEYSFATCSEDQQLSLAPLITDCLSGRAGNLLIVLLAYRYTPTIARFPFKTGCKVDLFADDIREALARRANALLLLESNLWYLASLGGFNGVAPYAVRYDLARHMWDANQPGHVLCLRCGSHVHYRRLARPGVQRHGRCRPCSRGAPDAWPAHATEPETQGLWWLRCQTEGCSQPFIGRADQLRCTQCRLDRNAATRRRPLRA